MDLNRSEVIELYYVRPHDGIIALKSALMSLTSGAKALIDHMVEETKGVEADFWSPR